MPRHLLSLALPLDNITSIHSEGAYTPRFYAASLILRVFDSDMPCGNATCIRLDEFRNMM